jgi:hypothetical protein
MLYATVDVARRVERAEIEFCALAGATQGAVDVLEAAGGRALFSRPGSPLNKVLGLGLHGALPDDAIDRIEAFYRDRNVPTQIEVCPLAYGDLAARLCARGYLLEAFENELGLLLDPTASATAASPPSTTVGITAAAPDQDDLWTQVVAEGFAASESHVGGAPEAKPPTTEQMVEMMSQFGHPEIRRYLAWIEGEPAGGGAAWAYDGVLGIFGTSTLPRFRRRGVQRALTIHALNEGRSGADLAIATTAPGSTSQRTFERLGFRVLYTRAVFVRS